MCTSQDEGLFSQMELKHFWNRVLFAKDSDNTLQLLGTANSYEFMSNQPSEVMADIPYQSLRFSLYDFMLNLTPFLTPDWCTDAFIKLFGHLCYILTQCGIYFFNALFLRFAFIAFPSFYRFFLASNAMLSLEQ